MLTRCPLPPLPKNDHGTTDRAALLPAPIPVVRTSASDDIGPRPTLYLPLWASASKGAGNLLEPVNGIPPSNRWADRTKEPMGGAVPPTLIHQSARLGYDAPPRHLGL